jgi:Fe2+ or Zn2+ uptake regulation protein
MTVRDDLLQVVPIGEGNKAHAQDLHQRMGCWSLITVKRVLDELEDEGAVIKTVVPNGGTRRNFYYREGTERNAP